MTRQEIATKLREALALMNNDGAHWIKGEYSEPIDWDELTDPEYGYCSLGAIRYVTGTPVEDPSVESDLVARALAEVLPTTLKMVEIAGYQASEAELAYETIVRWNDASNRTWEQVVERFNEAAVRTEQNT